MAKISDLAPDNSETNSPSRRKYDSTSREGFLDFMMNNVKEMQDSLNEKHDLSKDLSGVCLFARIITPQELIKRTSKSFSEGYINDSNGKIYECFVFVAGISDPMMGLVEEELEVFHLLKSAEGRYLEYKSNQAKTPKAEKKDMLLEMITKHFKKTEERRFVVNHIQKKIESFHRFYYNGAEDSYAPIGMTQCKIRFHDKKNLQYGKFIKSNALKNNSTTESLEASMKLVRKLIATAPIGASTSKSSKLREQVTGAASNLIPNIDTMGA
tara:strand:+ start:4251 stop:5057 length:807 start_codon:yes stop_codon:yes gene_type:complete